VNDETFYRNTDLVLTSAADLTPLAVALESAGLSPFGATRCDDGRRYVAFETGRFAAEPSEPAADIAAMLDAIEKLPPAVRVLWSACDRREFNIGCDPGVEPWSFEQRLPAALLGRIALAGASLAVTIYAYRAPDPADGPALPVGGA